MEKANANGVGPHMASTALLSRKASPKLAMVILAALAARAAAKSPVESGATDLRKMPSAGWGLSCLLLFRQELRESTPSLPI
jgi:hypothetical protein